MKEVVRTFVPRFVVALLLSLGIAVACSVALGEVCAEPAGSDVVTTPREALLREKPSLSAPILARLPEGSRLTLVEPREQFLRVEAPGLPGGWIARDVVVTFAPGPGPTRDLVVIGRAFGRNGMYRRLAACLLQRASERLREAKTPDPEVEVLLGETVEGLTAAGAPFPKELGITEKNSASGKRAVYDGRAFQRALEMLSKDASGERGRGREQALAGALRAQYRERSTSLQGLMQESSAWLQIVEAADDPAVLRACAERAGDASLALGRYLLALGKLEDLGRLEERVRKASGRVQMLSLDTFDGRRLAARSAVLHAMRGNGTPAFPQEARIAGGARERLARIDGKLGALQLVVETRAGGTHDVQIRRNAVPILPVPGSLRVSPDGKSAAWVEVAGPSHLVAVMTSLDRDEPAREIAFLSTGRPWRDRELTHVVSSLSGFSKDGQRLGLQIDAWNVTPGPAPRYSVISVATGELLYETSKDVKSFQRLLQ
jgi:hypothetical protein